MFSYQHHIGDFNKATRHLTRVERSIYRDLLDLYYETEKPLVDDLNQLCRLVIARSNEEIAAVEQVLAEFFHKNCEGWAHVRCELEIEKYRTNTSQKSEAGRASAAAREAKRQRIINGRSTDVGTAAQRDSNVDPTNLNPLTSEPLSVKPVKDLAPVAQQGKPAKNPLDYSKWPALPSDQIMTDWLAMRKRLKAPVSQTVIDRFATELIKAKGQGYTVDQCLAECVTRGWRGFEVQWLVNSQQQGQYKTAAEKEAERNAYTFNLERARDF